MSKRAIKKGSLNETLIIFIPDSASTAGGGKTGLEYNTSGLSCYYVRPGSAAVQLALVTQTVTGAHADGGFVEIDSTNLPGFYRLDLSDVIIASGVNSVAMMLAGASGMAPVSIEIQLDDNTVADTYTRIGENGAGLTAIGDTRLNHLDADITSVTPPTVTQIRQELDANSTRLSDILTDTAEVQAELANGGRTDLLIDSIIADTQDLLVRLTATRAEYLDKLNITGNVAAEGEAASAVTGLATKTELDAAVAPLATSVALSAVDDYIDTEVTAIKAVTDKLDTAMESDGGVYRFTANALGEGPSGTSGGGDATAANQATIIAHLTDIKGTGFSGTTDSLEAIRDRGDSAWITGSGLSGSNSVVINVHDGVGANVVESAVEIWDSAGTTFYERKTSDSSGQASFNMDDGTYTVKIHKAGYSKADQTLVVPDTLNPIYVMTAYSIPVPSDATKCRLYIYAERQAGQFPASLNARLTIIDKPFRIGNKYFTTEDEHGVYNPATGLLYFDVPQGANVDLKISTLAISKMFKVPSTPTAEIYTITGGVV